jgi:hypothetical protein
MKKRNIIAVFSALACLTLLPITQAAPAPETPDPGSTCPFCTADGTNALANASGSANSAFGWSALLLNTDASFNTAVGAGALLKNTQSSNTAVGAAALLNNTTGAQNTAVGTLALFSNIGGGGLAGQLNVAVGDHALFASTTGGENTAIGMNALQAEIDGLANTSLGHSAGFNLQHGSGNLYLGANVLGDASGTESNHTYIRNINNTNVSGGGTDTVTVDLTTGLLGHLTSSQRYKEDIKPMDKASEALYRLKPVTYRYKKEIDRTQSPAFGLIAEEVAEVNAALVARNAEGKPESVHYEMVNAMLLNEFLKEHKKVQDLEATVAQQHKGMEVLTAQLKEQAAQIEKVSAQVEVNKPAPQVVANKP